MDDTAYIIRCGWLAQLTNTNITRSFGSLVTATGLARLEARNAFNWVRLRAAWLLSWINVGGEPIEFEQECFEAKTVYINFYFQKCKKNRNIKSNLGSEILTAAFVGLTCSLYIYHLNFELVF